MKKIFLLLLALGIIGAGIGYYLYNKPVASLENKKPDVEVDASQLVAAYEADEKTANEKYLGKVVQVSGKIADITMEEGKKKVFLETTNPMSMVIFEMEDKSESGGLKTGDKVRMKGMCSGYLSDVILVQSSVVK